MTADFDAQALLGATGLGLACGLLLVLLFRGPLKSLGGAIDAVPAALRYGAVAALAAVSAVLLSASGKSPDTIATAPVAVAHTPAGPTSASPGKAGSMEAATAVLADRLATKGGSDQDWELLAQSYDFLGRKSEAQQARQHKLSPQRGLQDSVGMSAWLVAGARPSAASPAGTGVAGTKVAALLAQAEQHRRKREFQQACDAYRQVVAANGMTADAWADFADALASSNPSGSLRGEPATAIDRALALDPKHAKALWLKASLAHEERRYQDALVAWQQLLALVPPGSSDARIIQATIDEDRRLAGNRG
jgi:cytochrome c-type biogenesis protein CcmH/NrfG